MLLVFTFARSWSYFKKSQNHTLIVYKSNKSTHIDLYLKGTLIRLQDSIPANTLLASTLLANELKHSFMVHNQDLCFKKADITLHSSYGSLLWINGHSNRCEEARWVLLTHWSKDLELSDRPIYIVHKKSLAQKLHSLGIRKVHCLDTQGAYIDNSNAMSASE